LFTDLENDTCKNKQVLVVATQLDMIAVSFTEGIDRLAVRRLNFD